jgi:hypothetical protein
MYKRPTARSFTRSLPSFERSGAEAPSGPPRSWGNPSQPQVCRVQTKTVRGKKRLVASWFASWPNMTFATHGTSIGPAPTRLPTPLRVRPKGAAGGRPGESPGFPAVVRAATAQKTGTGSRRLDFSHCNAGALASSDRNANVLRQPGQWLARNWPRSGLRR